MASTLSTSKTKDLLDRSFSEIRSILQKTNDYLEEDFENALDILLKCDGKIIFCGLGKTGYIAQYASALFSSLGIKCQFLHANEALHGDMGIIDRNKDIFVFISFSGNGDEHSFLINQIKIPSILISSNRHSIVGKKADVNIEVQMNKSDESSPLNCVPTHSNVTIMFIINNLAMCYSASKNIQPSDFSINHPGGQIGKDMFLTIESLMRKKESLPRTTLDTTLMQALPMITSGHCGSIMLVDNEDKLLGIFTDGDLRRALSQPENLNKPLKEFRNQNFLTCQKETLAIDALNKMQSNKVTALIVLDHSNHWLGLIHIHDVLRSMKCSEEH